MRQRRRSAILQSRATIVKDAGRHETAYIRLPIAETRCVAFGAVNFHVAKDARKRAGRASVADSSATRIRVPSAEHGRLSIVHLGRHRWVQLDSRGRVVRRGKSYASLAKTSKPPSPPRRGW
jgi:hypothetical protein